MPDTKPFSFGLCLGSCATDKAIVAFVLPAVHHAPFIKITK